MPEGVLQEHARRSNVYSALLFSQGSASTWHDTATVADFGDLHCISVVSFSHVPAWPCKGGPVAIVRAVHFRHRAVCSSYISIHICVHRMCCRGVLSCGCLHFRLHCNPVTSMRIRVYEPVLRQCRWTPLNQIDSHVRACSRSRGHNALQGCTSRVELSLCDLA